MDTDWGGARAFELLDLASTWLEREAREKRWHTLLATNLGGLSILSGHARCHAAAERVLRDAPDEAFSAGVITNVDPPPPIVRVLPGTDDIEHAFPVYDRDAVVEVLRRSNDPHITLVLDGAPDEAWRMVTSEVDQEECVATSALCGDFDRVLAMLELLPADRREGPLMVVCIESFRRGDTATSRDVLDRLRVLPGDAWTWLHLASGFLGRVPWGGYPFPDY